MRRLLSFDCEESRLVATLDEAPGNSGLLIVSGGNEIRIGAHRGMAKLAADVSAEGHPVLRFDRRGIGDSEGENGGFESSGPDIAAAIAAFRVECPALIRIVAFGNCDAASALAIHPVAEIDALVFANPWVFETEDDLPPPAAIRSRYWERMSEPRAWVSLFIGAIDMRKLLAGLSRLARPPRHTSLAQTVAGGIAEFDGPVSIILANRDATAIAFRNEWKKSAFDTARGKVDMIEIDSSSHSFASDTDYAGVKSTLLNALEDLR